MKKNIFVTSLAITINLIAINKSQAENATAYGTCNSVGTCQWSLDADGKLSITGSGTMDTYVTVKNKIFTGNQPWQEYKDQIKSVDIQGVSNISFGLFREYTNIESVNIGASVERIEDRAFDQNHLSSIIIPQNVNYVGQDAFRSSVGAPEKEIILFSDSDIASWNRDAFNDASYPKEHFYCFGDMTVCSEKLKKFIATSAGGTCGEDGACIKNYSMEQAVEDQCNHTNYYWSGTSCNNKKNGIKCADNFKLDNGLCWRIRYTPAEVAKVVGESNTILLYYK